MKLKSFKQFLLERDINEIIAKTKDIPEEILTKIFDAIGDNKYLIPLARIYKKTPFDLNELPDILSKLEVNKLDIGKYKSFVEFKQALKNLISTKGIDKSNMLELYNPYDINDPNHERKIRVPANGDSSLFPLVWKTGNWRIYSPKSLKACETYTPMKYLGWCTAGSNHYPSYADGDLYDFVNGNEFKAQLFVSKDRSEFMKPSKNPTSSGPASQKPIDLDKFRSENPELEKFFRKIIKPTATIDFMGRKFNYIVNSDGDIEVDTIDISDLGLTSLVDLPWNSQEYLQGLVDKWNQLQAEAA